MRLTHLRDYVRKLPEWPKKHAEGCPRRHMLPEDDALSKVEPEAYVCNCGVSEARRALLGAVRGEDPVTRKRAIIRECWVSAEAGDAGASTERLFAITIEQASMRLGFEIDAGDVAEALAEMKGGEP